MLSEFSRAEEIATVNIERPHVVILGAGASVAACPAGDANGRRLPVMADFIDRLDLAATLRSMGLPVTGNFETIYAGLCEEARFDDLRSQLEASIYDYFFSLELPPEATIYDRLILSLRPKDVIATFNWDPFLVQALTRNRSKALLPKTLFLHGNVAVRVCSNDKKAFFGSSRCPTCGSPTEPTRLLYPIAQKSYASDAFIASQWEMLRRSLQSAFMLTIFGYGAPASDTEAVALMSQGWGDASTRELEQTEVVDIKSEQDILRTWKPFIHTHHYEVMATFDHSWLSKHPRRSGEAWWQQYIEAKFIDDNPLPLHASLPDLHNWIESLVANEV